MILENFWYQLISIFIIGLIMGSFYNVVIIRTLSGESIIYPESKCPNCDTKLKWWEKIPVLSFILLKGKCSYCNKPIDIIYPTVEILTAIIYVIMYIKFGLCLKYLLAIICLSIFLILAGMDIKEKKISSKLVYFSIIASVLFNYNNLLDSILGMLLGGVLISLVRKILSYFSRKEVVGEGDIYAIISLSALCGLRNLGYVFLSILIFQLLLSIPNVIKKIFKKKEYLFGFLLIWFILSYLLAFLVKNYFIYPSLFCYFLIFLNLILSILILCKYLYQEMKNNQNLTIIAFLPSIFLSALTFLFFI